MIVADKQASHRLERKKLNPRITPVPSLYSVPEDCNGLSLIAQSYTNEVSAASVQVQRPALTYQSQHLH